MQKNRHLATEEQQKWSVDDWWANGQPEIWVEACQFEHAILDQDLGYGRLRLTVGEQQHTSKDYVRVGVYVGLSETYGYPKPVLLKQVA